ncbi:glycosyl transferase family 2 [Microcella alkaliphila]|uniref:Glycosyl transferase family 2 n=2 Tax=Microcella alkaliphila TaxID=279828 RepID=A0A4Q7TF24_9MICO|nr:glycosyl transferase family 2 [Microcella alkaliphila]
MTGMPEQSSTPASVEALATTWAVIPLYNEAAVVGDVIRELRESIPNVVCVDDGSRDGSAEIAEAAGARVLRHPHNMGQGAALQTGIAYARTQPGCQYVVTFDADGQHRVEDALAMVGLSERDGYAIVLGSRFLDDRTDPGFRKRLVLKLAAAVTNAATGMTLTDAHNGLRALRVDAAHVVNLQQDRMAHASEIVAQLGRSGLPWAEFPVHIRYTDYSKAKGQSMLNSINIVVDLVIR